MEKIKPIELHPMVNSFSAETKIIEKLNEIINVVNQLIPAPPLTPEQERQADKDITRIIDKMFKVGVSCHKCGNLIVHPNRAYMYVGPICECNL